MSINTIIIIGAFIAGVLIAAQGILNARLARHIGGSLHAAIVSFTVGLLALLIITMVIGSNKFTVTTISTIPIWVWFGGLLGMKWSSKIGHSFVLLVQSLKLRQLQRTF